MGQSRPGPLSKRAASSSRCPICKAPAEGATRPFCCTRCADVDLSRWLRGAYAIPGVDQDSDEDGDTTQAAQRPAGGDDGRKGDEEE